MSFLTETAPVDPTAPNTEVWYQYRDAANYKATQVVVLPGRLDDTQVATVEAGLDDGEFFLPAQVGLDVLYDTWGTHHDDDHVWHELLHLHPTHAAPTGEVSAEEFAAAFVDVEWDVVVADQAQAEWKAVTPAGT